jgi:hypothetical protein
MVVLVVALPSDARADTTQFGSNDIATVFFIAKSSGPSRVDYGIRLNEHCAPVNDEALFPYWRELDKTPVNLHSLNIFEYVPYGFAEQRLVHRTLVGGDQLVRLKQLERPILVTTKKEADGRCSAQAHARIGGVEGALLVSVYAQMTGPMSVDHIDIHGKNPQTGADILERVQK